MSSPSSCRIFFFPFQTRSMWMVFCEVLLNCLFASWCLIKSLPNCCVNCYVAFSFEKVFYNKILFFFWYLRHCYIESLPEKIFLNIFLTILSSELSNYDPWNSLFICQFPDYLINKAVVLSDQQQVNFYENNNLRLCGLQNVFQKIRFNMGRLFFETPCIVCIYVISISSNESTILVRQIIYALIPNLI